MVVNGVSLEMGVDLGGLASLIEQPQKANVSCLYRILFISRAQSEHACL